MLLLPFTYCAASRTAAALKCSTERHAFLMSLPLQPNRTLWAWTSPNCCSLLSLTAPARLCHCHSPPAAQLDPLGLDERPKIKELDPAFYGFSEKDLDRE